MKNDKDKQPSYGKFKALYMGEPYERERQEIESYSITEIQYFHRQGKDYDYCKEHEVRELESAYSHQQLRIDELEVKRQVACKKFEDIITVFKSYSWDCSDIEDTLRKIKEKR